MAAVSNCWEPEPKKKMYSKTHRDEFVWRERVDFVFSYGHVTASLSSPNALRCSSAVTNERWWCVHIMCPEYVWACCGRQKHLNKHDHGGFEGYKWDGRTRMYLLNAGHACIECKQLSTNMKSFFSSTDTCGFSCTADDAIWYRFAPRSLLR